MGFAGEPADTVRISDEGTRGKIQCQPLRLTRCPATSKLRAETCAPAEKYGSPRRSRLHPPGLIPSGPNTARSIQISGDSPSFRANRVSRTS